jgi:hypothetical protein
MEKKKEGLELLRSPFPDHQISKLPKPTKDQTDEVKKDFKKGIRCTLCGGWHHPKVQHLDYVGHAALTDRLLDSDPNWTWEPMATENGLPRFDSTGGLWIKLTVCGLTRLGYGNAQASEYKEVGSREKEVIGDALRNAAMRFGAALDLWHKGDLHLDGENKDESAGNSQQTGNDNKSTETPDRGAKAGDIPAEKGAGKISENEYQTQENDTRNTSSINGEMVNHLLKKLEAAGKNTKKFYDWMNDTHGTRNPMALKAWQYEQILEMIDRPQQR